MRGEKRKGREGTSMVVHWLRLCSQCRGFRFDPWSGNKDPTCHRVWTKKKKRQGRKIRRRKRGNGRRREEEEDKEKESLLIINPIKWHLGYTGEERKILSTLPNYP